MFSSRVFVIALFAILPWPAWGLDHVAFVRDDVPQSIVGKVLVEAQDGGLLVLDGTGRLWAVTPDERPMLTQDPTAFELFGKEQLAERLLAELPAGFRIHDTAHYLIAYNTSPTYAQWCGSLLERLYAGFTNYWQRRGFELHDPPAPLVALVFDRKSTYAAYSRQELGDATDSIIGYFSLATNRVTMYDLTGIDALSGGARISSTEHINRLLSRPEAERLVATVIHEATHQLAFNCGMQTRYADIPLWLSEGIAIYFETPDLKSSKAWRGIGDVNTVRLAEFRQYLRSRPVDSLRTLIGTDERFRNTRTASQAYAEAWALNYFLIRKYSDKYQDYLRHLSGKKPLLFDTPQERLAEVEEIFGKPLAELDTEFVRYLAALR